MKTTLNKWFVLTIMFIITIPTWAQLPEEDSSEDPAAPIDSWYPILIIVAIAVAYYFIKNRKKAIA